MVWSTHLRSWVKMLLQALDKAPKWCVLSILWLNLFCTTLFLGFSKATCWNLILVYELPLLNTNNFACFFIVSFKSTNMKWSDIKTNSYFGIHFAITNKIGERKICQLALTLFIYKICKDCNFQCKSGVTQKWFKSNNIIISWT